MPAKRILVVGTTPDYVELLYRRFGDRLLFVTDPGERASASETSPDRRFELMTPLGNIEDVWSALTAHCRDHDININGVVCFDCQSLSLAAHLAKRLNLPFVSPEAVANARNKHRAKELWRAAGVDCPASAIIHTANEAAGFLEAAGGPVIFKPMAGAGSELVTKCHTAEECRTALEHIQHHLAQHPDLRMYAVETDVLSPLDGRRVVVAEEFIDGSEFSCDFLYDSGRATIIRLTKKIADNSLPVGTTVAYEIPAELPDTVSLSSLQRTLAAAARALGFGRTVAMVDFIVNDNGAFLLEMTPRPGGDCLPFLLQQSGGFDIFQLTLDVAEGRHPDLPPAEIWQPMIGLRLLAAEPGTISNIDLTTLWQDVRVVDVYVKRRPGHVVALPPADYDSRVLGHVIFWPHEGESPDEQVREIQAKLMVTMEKSTWSTSAQS